MKVMDSLNSWLTRRLASIVGSIGSVRSSHGVQSFAVMIYQGSFLIRSAQLSILTSVFLFLSQLGLIALAGVLLCAVLAIKGLKSLRGTQPARVAAGIF